MLTMDCVNPGAARGSADRVDVDKFVTQKCPIPGGGEQGRGRPVAEAIGAFPAHPHGGRGAGNAAGPGEEV